MNNFTGMHSFYIPVMGTGFTVDTPLRIAKYGISSTISLVDDLLIEQMRKYHSENNDEPYEPITNADKDHRAKRITLYLNLLNRLVKRQVAVLKKEPFSPDSDITRYFELLPDGEIRGLYTRMLAEDDPDKKNKLQDQLRTMVIPGSIDVNIMTKLDRDYYEGDEKLPPEFSDAMAALRGFALSDVESSIIFSAGVNTRLYSYLATFDDFYPDAKGNLRKKVVLKVSDYRSAEIQGNFFAKKGIWVSEYRVESGLNCGGHAFPGQGHLMGPILDQFKKKRHELIDKLFARVSKTLQTLGRNELETPPPVKLTVQGGIGTNSENEMLFNHYKVDGTGWGTPFLLVPEATNIDEAHLEQLKSATEDEVVLSDSSPLSIPFWNLLTAGSEIARRKRIADGKPGSGCPQKHLVSNTEFTQLPICTASREYQKLKLESLKESDYSPEEYAARKKLVLDKSCICSDLSGSVRIKTGIKPNAAPSICVGPNIVNFTKTVSLEEMINHIYGRGVQLIGPGRPHMFIRELMLYVDCFKNELEKVSLDLSDRKEKYFDEFRENLLVGIEHYRKLLKSNVDIRRNEFREELKTLCEAVEALKGDTDKVLAALPPIRKKEILAHANAGDGVGKKAKSKV